MVFMSICETNQTNFKTAGTMNNNDQIETISILRMLYLMQTQVQ